MMKALVLYTILRYGTIATEIIAKQFEEDFSYMSSCNMGILVPDKYIKTASISRGLFPQYMNEGAIIK